MVTRIISGVVGAGLLAVVLYFHDTMVLPAAVAVIIAVMLYELLRAVKLHNCIPILAASEICGMIMPFIYERYYVYPEGIIGGSDSRGCDGRVAVEAFAVTLLAAFVIFVTWLKKHKEIEYGQIFFVLACMVLVPQAMSTMVRIERSSREDGLFLLIMALCGAWIADTGAYFTGVAIGKHKLCPEISPKKTIEGFVGGILTTGIVYAAAFSIRGGTRLEHVSVGSVVVTGEHIGGFSMITLLAFILGIVCAVIGTVGDLSASMVKRQIGFKDYGKIMPGHGGLMDRFDSVLFVLPVFYAFNELIGVF